ncbi:hypothetical protein RCO28_32400 [Streptomyces sp. LHD-70]|nr:hypothetical protein [Streptomyces sp. LHD-70]MDQ8707135.1 hypothetical protein [Streptomyces sp. LHD-70]
MTRQASSKIQRCPSATGVPTGSVLKRIDAKAVETQARTTHDESDVDGLVPEAEPDVV